MSPKFWRNDKKIRVGSCPDCGCGIYHVYDGEDIIVEPTCSCDSGCRRVETSENDYDEPYLSPNTKYKIIN